MVNAVLTGIWGESVSPIARAFRSLPLYGPGCAYAKCSMRQSAKTSPLIVYAASGKLLDLKLRCRQKQFDHKRNALDSQHQVCQGHLAPCLPTPQFSTSAPLQRLYRYRLGPRGLDP